jgi:type III pantothenate kinase
MGERQDFWLGLIIGNTRWHWGSFEGDRWLDGWHTPSLSELEARSLLVARLAPDAFLALAPSVCLPEFPQAQPDLWVASVVQAPLGWLANYPALHPVTLAEVPLGDTYPTLGIDRALALVGAGVVYGWPVLVIDCGTAITFTAGAAQRLIGGAILPGLRSQFRALSTDTDQLPLMDGLSEVLPQRWATDTPGAIASGILYTQLAGIRDFVGTWGREYPGGTVVITGGDGQAIFSGLQQQTPDLAQRMRLDLDLGFWGLRVCRGESLNFL